MLNQMYDLFQREFSEPMAAWDRFIEFLAVDHQWHLVYQLDHHFQWLAERKKLVSDVSCIYRPELLTKYSWDFLGDLYFDRVLGSQRAREQHLALTPEQVADIVCQADLENGDKTAVLDPSAGTGRVLLAAWGRFPTLRLYGIEKDIRLARIALTNFAIHGIEAYVLNADPALHETDLSKPDGRQNWQYANNWNPCWDKLKPRISGISPVPVSPS